MGTRHGSTVLLPAPPARPASPRPRVQVTFFGEVIADSPDAIRVVDGAGASLYYFPRCDVKLHRLHRATRRDRCPRNGDVTYYTISNGRLSEHGAWSFEHPHEQGIDLKDRIAFDPDKVDCIRIFPEHDDDGREPPFRPASAPGRSRRIWA